MKITRLKLTPNLPPKSAEFKNFESFVARLNDFYWANRLALKHLLETSNGQPRLIDYAPRELAEKIDISVSEFRSSLPDVELSLRFMVIVQAVTVYEDFIYGTLSNLLLENLELDKTYSLKIRLSEVETAPPPLSGFSEVLLTSKL